jgi:hypothetical protein
LLIEAAYSSNILRLLDPFPLIDLADKYAEIALSLSLISSSCGGSSRPETGNGVRVVILNSFRSDGAISCSTKAGSVKYLDGLAGHDFVK